MVLCIGSSLHVTPAADLPEMCEEVDGRVHIVNLQETDRDELVQRCVDGERRRPGRVRGGGHEKNSLKERKDGKGNSSVRVKIIKMCVGGGRGRGWNCFVCSGY